MEIFYKKWKKYNEIQSTKNKMNSYSKNNKSYAPFHVHRPVTHKPSYKGTARRKKNRLLFT